MCTCVNLVPLVQWCEPRIPCAGVHLVSLMLGVFVWGLIPLYMHQYMHQYMHHVYAVRNPRCSQASHCGSGRPSLCWGSRLGACPRCHS